MAVATCCALERARGSAACAQAGGSGNGGSSRLCKAAELALWWDGGGLSA